MGARGNFLNKVLAHRHLSNAERNFHAALRKVVKKRFGAGTTRFVVFLNMILR